MALIKWNPFRDVEILQQNSQPNLVTATFKNGVLETEIPKPEKDPPKQITVKVE